MSSHLERTITRVRTYMDEVADSAKFPDSVVMAEFVKPAITEVIHRVNNTSQIPVVAVYDFTLPANAKSFGTAPCGITDLGIDDVGCGW